MEPRQLVSRLLTKSKIRTILGTEPHIFEIGGRQAFHIRKSFTPIYGELFDHLGTPALSALAVKDITVNIVIKSDLLFISRQQDTLKGTGYPPFQAGKPVSIIRR